MAQAVKILARLKDGYTLTDNDARELWRCTRLAARIHDLKRQGHRIETTMEPHRGGQHARYRLVDEPQQVELFG